MARKRVLVIVNKWWECDPIMNVLLNDHAHSVSILGWPSTLYHPHHRPDKTEPRAERKEPVPRAIFTLPNISLEVWCVSDLLEHLPDEPEYQSSSARKIEQLPVIFVGQNPDLVVAIGTAALPGETSENGNVVVGTNIFMHNANLKNPYSNWNGGPFDTVISSSFSQSAFASIISIDPAALDRFMVTPLNKAVKEKLIAGYDYVALGTINITDPKKYSLADKETIASYQTTYDRELAKSMETTHCLIRVQAEVPFVFVSGIVNRVGHFADEINPRSYAQNTTAAHNAGIILAAMIPKINDVFN